MADQLRSKTVLGPDCKISGDLVLDNDAVIMGGFSGTLRVTGVLEITDSASVQGTVVAGMLKVAGSVEADMVAEEAVELLPGATVNGQIYTARLTVADGASFDGDVHVGPRAVEQAGEVMDRVGSAESAAPRPSAQAGEPVEGEHKPGNGNPNAMLQRRRPQPYGFQKRLATNGAGHHD
jgi:cytoskeletal protein CcmA (bactofilin family)